MKKFINVLIVDDSPIVRDVLTKLLNADEQINVLAAVEDPYQAAKVIRRGIPDVITLDIEMPRMDGLTFLKKIMEQRPIPVVIISSLTKRGAEQTLKAISYGAVEVVEKPKMHNAVLIEEAGIQICDKVKAASMTKLKKKFAPLVVRPKYSADVIIPKPLKIKPSFSNEQIIVIGASTGGTEAIKVVLEQLPANSPGVVIVQHMPEVFTKSFAERLNQICELEVKEAQDGDFVEKGKALVAPGNFHVVLKSKGTGYVVSIVKGKLVNRHRPSIDVLFRSASIVGANKVLAVILTGMGDDGARGIAEIKAVGGYTIAQDEESSVVYGMPKEALKHDRTVKVLALNDIAPFIKSYYKI